MQYKDGYCKGAKYFGIIEDSIANTGEYVKTGTFKFGKLKMNVVKWTGKIRKFEYWECEDCYNEGIFEFTLKNKIEKIYGPRCKDYNKDCIVCLAWAIYDTTIKDDRCKL